MRAISLEVHRSMLCLDAGLGLPGALLVVRSLGPAAGARYTLAILSACAVQHAFVRGVQRRTGVEESTWADVLTLARMATGATLAGLVAASVNGRALPVRWPACLMTLAMGSVVDWVDGPLARRLGPTRLGAALDIEADSWLTLWSAAAAVVGRGLPRFCLIPPVMRYLLPVVAVARGDVPRGDGSWWCRAAGISQMVLIIVSLAPLRRRPHGRAFQLIAGAVSTAQAVVIAVLLARQLRRRSGE